MHDDASKIVIGGFTYTSLSIRDVTAVSTRTRDQSRPTTTTTTRSSDYDFALQSNCTVRVLEATYGKMLVYSPNCIRSAAAYLVSNTRPRHPVRLHQVDYASKAAIYVGGRLRACLARVHSAPQVWHVVSVKHPLPQLAEGLAAAACSRSFLTPHLAKCVADDSSDALAEWPQLWHAVPAKHPRRNSLKVWQHSLPNVWQTIRPPHSRRSRSCGDVHVRQEPNMPLYRSTTAMTVTTSQ
jgi:hypothetical protein